MDHSYDVFGVNPRERKLLRANIELDEIEAATKYLVYAWPIFIISRTLHYFLDAKVIQPDNSGKVLVLKAWIPKRINVDHLHNHRTISNLRKSNIKPMLPESQTSITAELPLGVNDGELQANHIHGEMPVEGSVVFDLYVRFRNMDDVFTDRGILWVVPGDCLKNATFELFFKPIVLEHEGLLIQIILDAEKVLFKKMRKHLEKNNFLEILGNL